MSETTPSSVCDLPLPPPDLRMNSPAQREDDIYRRSAVGLVRAVQAVLGAERFSIHRRVRAELPEMRVLDLGCGTARFLHGLVAARQSPKSYVGIDVQADQIAWCRKTLAPLGAFQFHHINVKNDRYNPSGTDTIEGRVPFPNAEADFIMLRSVLTHMRTQEAERTLKELRRCLAPGGRLYATANVAHGAPIWTDLPNDRGVTSTLLKVQFNKAYFETMLEETGFRVSIFCESIENQCVYLLRPA
ncbi:MAG: class I SAM-dependent methyltransferase [Rhodobacteraceae bacterium]|jgi:SAM-dependent methyltransferase|nr:class I SAM-dependent methyltransferase [Paracoccaceae bacterium]MBL4558449.1 class I SAM-dependent methyltransferase [Paracoccaceae bacterium]